jgi:hypothetical protein
MNQVARNALLGGAAICALIGAAAAQDNVGVTAAVNPDATGTPPQRATRTLNVGLDMFKNERVTTGPEGKTQLLFIDGSALSIGPNSEVVLDEFVYDPKTETGKLAMTATKGVFRLVGGKLSKTEPVMLKTPTATIGIRGGIVTVENDFVGFLFGKEATVQGTAPEAPSVSLVRPGTGVPLLPGGQLGVPSPIPVERIVNAMTALEGVRGRSGGASEQPTEGRVRAGGVGQASAASDSDALSESGASESLGALGAAVSRVNVARASQVQALSDFQDGRSQVLGLLGRYKTTPGSGTARGPGDTSSVFNRPLFGDVLGTLFSGFTIGFSGFSEFSFNNDFVAPVTGTLVETTQRGMYFDYASAGTRLAVRSAERTGVRIESERLLLLEPGIDVPG